MSTRRKGPHPMWNVIATIFYVGGIIAMIAIWLVLWKIAVFVFGLNNVLGLGIFVLVVALTGAVVFWRTFR